MRNALARRTCIALVQVGGGLRKHGAWFFSDTTTVHTSFVTCNVTTSATTALAQHLLGADGAKADGVVMVGGESAPPSPLSRGNHTLDGSKWVFHARFDNGTRGTGYALLPSPGVRRHSNDGNVVFAGGVNSTRVAGAGAGDGAGTLQSAPSRSFSVEIGPRSGDWSALGTASGLITRDVFGLWVDHPCSSNGDAVAFAVRSFVHLLLL